MSIDEMKTEWNQRGRDKKVDEYDQASLEKVIKSRARQHTGMAFKYFWAAFALQILVYSMLAHVIVKYWSEPMTTIPALFGIVIYIPFTLILMRKFKGIALVDSNQFSISTYVSRQRELLESFYKFKKRYELALIPLATSVGTFLVFELYVPGGMWAYPQGAMITFLISLASCVIAIQAENKKNFERPLSELKAIVDEFKS
jgi:hypothetical protein